MSIIAYASGIIAGLGTLYIMAMNGLLLGVLGTVCHRAGMSLALWSFVAPHGTLELPAIFIAGGAGLMLGRSLVVASDRPRRECLVDAGRTSLRLFGGVVPLLIIAGLIEGFVSPTGLDPLPSSRSARRCSCCWRVVSRPRGRRREPRQQPAPYALSNAFRVP